MRIYFAAPYNRKVETLDAITLIKSTLPKTEVTSRWLTNGFVNDNVPTEVLVEEAVNDVQDIEACSMFVLFNLPNYKSTSGAMFVEFGLAWAMGKFIVLIGEKTQIFHYHPAIHWFPDVAAYIAWMLKEHSRV